MMASLPAFMLPAVLLLPSVVARSRYGAVTQPQGLSPRYYLGLSPHLLERQSGICEDGSHSCRDVNSTSCCSNDQYCIVDSDLTAKCCAIGSDCGITACPSAFYQCASTTTIDGTPTTTAACCPRSCPTVSQFKCPEESGGGCCGYGSMCGSNKQCVSTVAATNSQPGLSIVPSGCTTSQTACPTSMGGGCCDIGLSCTVVENTNYCASQSGARATRTGPNGIVATAATQNDDGGLSTGAKAGIGAGVAVGALVVIAILVYFLIVHRRLVKQESELTRSSSQPTLSRGSKSEVSKARPVPDRQMSQPSDYFGPAAQAGPFTESGPSPGHSPGNLSLGGVPANPQRPTDIQAPVEIYSHDRYAVNRPGNLSVDITPYTDTSNLEELKSENSPVELP